MHASLSLTGELHILIRFIHSACFRGSWLDWTPSNSDDWHQLRYICIKHDTYVRFFLRLFQGFLFDFLPQMVSCRPLGSSSYPAFRRSGGKFLIKIGC